MANYDINEVNVIANNNIVTGFSDGTVISVAKEEDNFETHVGVKGEVTATETHNKVHVVTLTLKQTSPSVRLLRDLAVKRGADAEFPLQVVDLNEDALQFGGTRARVRRVPDSEYSNELSEREFEIVVFDGEYK